MDSKKLFFVLFKLIALAILCLSTDIIATHHLNQNNVCTMHIYRYSKSWIILRFTCRWSHVNNSSLSLFVWWIYLFVIVGGGSPYPVISISNISYALRTLSAWFLTSTLPQLTANNFFKREEMHRANLKMLVVGKTLITIAKNWAWMRKRITRGYEVEVARAHLSRNHDTAKTSICLSLLSSQLCVPIFGKYHYKRIFGHSWSQRWTRILNDAFDFFVYINTSFS